MNWIQTNKNFLRAFPPDRKYLVGVSGGRDSVALLHWLGARDYKNLVVCHFNHRLRGKASDRDEKFVANLAAKNGFNFENESADVRALAKKQKMSIEAAAREVRYKFFAQVAKRKRAPTIFLGHHADDVVETFLINLFRGAGSSGLSAMRELSMRRVDDVDLTVVRPFLGIWRAEIDDYVRKHRLKFREDASNRELTLLRNRIRRQIVPYLEKTLGRNIRQSVWRTAMIASEEENWIEAQLPNASDVDSDAGALAKEALVVATLRELPVALQRRGILKWLRGCNVSNIGFDVVENVRALLDHESGLAKINLSQDRHVRRRAGKIFIE
jgi:tRNA(Ile)-lysidine synthase